MNEDGTPTGGQVQDCTEGGHQKLRMATWHRKIAVFDAEGAPITNEVRIGNGSKVRVAVQPDASMPCSRCWTAVSLSSRLQIVELIEYNPESSDVSFEAVDGGYKHENNNDNGEGANDGSEEEFFSSEENEEDFKE